MEHLLIILKILSFSWFLTNFTPLVNTMTIVKSKNFLWLLFKQVITCWKCCALWTGIIYIMVFQPWGLMWLVFLTSMIADLINKNYNKLIL